MRKWLFITAAIAVVCSTAHAQQESNWYAFRGGGDPAAGEIGLQDWVDKPAGRSGRITRQGENLVYNGKPIKLWGLNLCFENCVPPKELADRRAAFYAKGRSVFRSIEMSVHFVACNFRKILPELLTTVDSCGKLCGIRKRSIFDAHATSTSLPFFLYGHFHSEFQFMSPPFIPGMAIAAIA